VEALCTVRHIKKVKVFSRDRSKAEAFAGRVREKLGIDACAVSDPHEAVRASALVVTATTASAPVIEGEWLEEGTHVSGIGANTRTKRELDAACFKGARVVADSREHAMEESGDLRDAIESGAVTADQIYAELGELAVGSKEGRSSSKEITIFKSVGVALQDIAVATSLFENAVRLGLGTQLDPYIAGRHFVETR
jgi:ornithine cyclodeaminase/alanine dehydrogenase-like protein (mu-crystallin family)